MEKEKIKYNGREYECIKYDKNDFMAILEPFFSWKLSSLVAEHWGKEEGGRNKRPPLPESFSEKLCCYMCNLYRNQGNKPDAFLIKHKKEIIPVEIKATVTEKGFQQVNNRGYKELYWVSFPNVEQLKFKIYKFTKQEIGVFTRAKKIRDNKFNFEDLARYLKRKEMVAGRIGIIKKF
jgi:hypothetical protein